MFSAEALALIQKTAQAAQSVEVLPVEDPRVCHVRVNGPDGATLQTITRPQPLRCHKPHSIAALCNFIASWIAGGEGTPAIWHNRSEITVLLDDCDRRDVLVMPLGASQHLRALLAIDRQSLGQREFCRRLKLDLGVPETWVGQFRRLDWSSSRNATTTHARGHDRLGAEIRAEVNGIDKLPETLELSIPLYEADGANTPWPIVCNVEVDPDPNAQTITLATRPGAVSAAHDLAQEDIAEMLTAALEPVKDRIVGVFYGTP